MRSMTMMVWAGLIAVVVGGMSATALQAQAAEMARVQSELAAAQMRLQYAAPGVRQVHARLQYSQPSLAMARMAAEQSRVAIAQARQQARGSTVQARQYVLQGVGTVRGHAPRVSTYRTGLGLVSRRADFSTEAPEAWIQDDPATDAYRAARDALNRRRYQAAAEAFASMRERYPSSGYVGDSFYWQAFALFRQGGNGNLRRAQELLGVQNERHREATTRADARELLVRIEAQLARRGDQRAAISITEQAQDPCGPEQGTRLAALSALLNMNADRAVPILKEVLGSRDGCSVELRRRAVFLLSQKMDDETVDILLDLAHRNPDPDPEVREQAVFWLHQVDGPEALDALEAILTESEDSELQERAIFAISQRTRDRRAVEILKDYAMRSDVDRNLRENAIFWIGQNSGTDGATFLIELYPQLDDDELRERAIFAVAQSDSDEGHEWLMERAMDTRESIDLRKNALFWAGQTGEISADDLQQVYDTVDDTEMKEQVIFVASQRDEPQAVDFLMDVARAEEDQELRERAIFWLGQSDDERVPEFLLNLIRIKR